jgi:hypothetical protein
MLADKLKLVMRSERILSMNMLFKFFMIMKFVDLFLKKYLIRVSNMIDENTSRYEGVVKEIIGGGEYNIGIIIEIVRNPLMSSIVRG